MNFLDKIFSYLKIKIDNNKKIKPRIKGKKVISVKKNAKKVNRSLKKEKVLKRKKSGNLKKKENVKKPLKAKKKKAKKAKNKVSTVVKKKVVKKKAVKKKTIKSKNIKPKGKKASLASSCCVGEITHFFSRIEVAVIKINKGKIAINQDIKIVGKSTSFEQKIESIQIENNEVREGKKGQLIGLKVKNPVKIGDLVYLS